MGHNIQTMEVVKGNGTIELYASVSSRNRRTVLNKGERANQTRFYHKVNVYAPADGGSCRC